MNRSLGENRCKELLAFVCRSGSLLVLVAILLSGCSRPDQQMRSRVRGNLHKIEAYLWEEMARLNSPTFDKVSGQSLPAEVGRHAEGAFATPIPPRDRLEKLLTLPDGMVHEQYDVLADRAGFEQWGGCLPTHAGCLGATIWRPRWMEIRGFALSGPGKTMECLSLRIGWQGLDAKPANRIPLTFAEDVRITKQTSEAFCPPSSWQGQLLP
jgi:hypothetical protein